MPSSQVSRNALTCSGWRVRSSALADTRAVVGTIANDDVNVVGHHRPAKDAPAAGPTGLDHRPGGAQRLGGSQPNGLAGLEGPRTFAGVFVAGGRRRPG